jgi:hypothetical protein
MVFTTSIDYYLTPTDLLLVTHYLNHIKTNETVKFSKEHQEQANANVTKYGQLKHNKVLNHT